MATRVTRANIYKLTQQQVVGTSTAAQLIYAYDLADRITQITYPSGRIVQYLRDAKGRVNLVQTNASSSVTIWTMLADSFTYEPFAAVKAMRFGNGLVAANDWGNDVRLASRRLYAMPAASQDHEFTPDKYESISKGGRTLL